MCMEKFSTRFSVKVVTTYHRMVKLEIDIFFHKGKRHEKDEFFNVKNTKCQEVNFQFTSKGDMFSK